MAETPKFHRFKEPRTSSPGSAPSSTRPIPSFLEDSKTFSTKKVRKTNRNFILSNKTYLVE